MTLYNYVSGKDALSDLVLDHILSPVRVPGPDAGTWQQRMRTLQSEARGVLRAHVGLSLRNGWGSRESRRLAEGVLSILATGGFPPEAAARAFSVLFTFMLGQIEIDALAMTDPGREASFSAVTEASGLSSDERFQFGFDAVLVGLEHLLGPTIGDT